MPNPNKTNLQATLMVKHKDEYKMVGKVFMAPVRAGSKAHELIFYHKVESGSQWHYGTNSPGGVDRAVLRWLAGAGVETVHQEIGSTLYVASVSDVVDEGIFELSDERARYYLPREFWQVHTHRWYRVPWIVREKKIVDYELARKREGIKGLIIPD